MTDSFTIDRVDDITIIRFLKPLTIEDFRAAVDEFATSPSKLRMWIVDYLFDLSSIKILDLTDYAASRNLPVGKSAIVSPVETTCGLGRMYNTYLDKKITKIKMFRSVQEANEWLKAEDDE